MSELLAKAKGLVPAIRITIELSKNFNRAKEIFERDNPTPEGQFPSFENYEKFRNDSLVSNAEAAIVSHLASLTYDEVTIIKAIMYAGRDEQDPRDIEAMYDEENYSEIRQEAWRNGVFDSPQKKIFDLMKQVKSSRDSKEIEIEHMLEKEPLPEYLERGIRILDL